MEGRYKMKEIDNLVKKMDRLKMTEELLEIAIATKNKGELNEEKLENMNKTIESIKRVIKEMKEEEQEK